MEETAPALERPIHILATVTFNSNQLQAHLLPLVALSEVGSITLVSDVAGSSLPKVRVVVPPRLLTRVVGRSLAKLLVCLWMALRERPSWVLGFYYVPHGFNAQLVAALTRRKSLYHMIGGEIEWLGGGWRSGNGVLGKLPRPIPVLERLLLRLMRRCTAVATMGEAARAMLLERGFDPGRVHVIPPSVDTERFSGETRHERPRDYDVVNVGALIERKRTADVIRAVADLQERHPGIRVAIVGDGPLLAELRRLAARTGVAPRLEFLGFRDSIESVYAHARTFVLTSEAEGLPVAMLEAMSSGVPPVVTAVGEIPRFVRPGETGFVVPVGDVAAMTDALDRLLSDEGLRTAIGAAAAADVRLRTSIEAVSQAYQCIFRTA